MHTPYADATGMLLHTNGKFSMGNSRYHMSLTYNVYLFRFCEYPLNKYQNNDDRACIILVLVNKQMFRKTEKMTPLKKSITIHEITK